MNFALLVVGNSIVSGHLIRTVVLGKDRLRNGDGSDAFQAGSPTSAETRNLTETCSWYSMFVVAAMGWPSSRSEMMLCASRSRKNRLRFPLRCSPSVDLRCWMVGIPGLRKDVDDQLRDRYRFSDTSR